MRIFDIAFISIVTHLVTHTSLLPNRAEKKLIAVRDRYLLYH